MLHFFKDQSLTTVQKWAGLFDLLVESCLDQKTLQRGQPQLSIPSRLVFGQSVPKRTTYLIGSADAGTFRRAPAEVKAPEEAGEDDGPSVERVGGACGLEGPGGSVINRWSHGCMVCTIHHKRLQDVQITLNNNTEQTGCTALQYTPVTISPK